MRSLFPIRDVIGFTASLMTSHKFSLFAVFSELRRIIGQSVIKKNDYLRRLPDYFSIIDAEHSKHYRVWFVCSTLQTECFGECSE